MLFTTALSTKDQALDCHVGKLYVFFSCSGSDRFSGFRFTGNLWTWYQVLRPGITEGKTQPRVETACEYSCVRGLEGASRLTERVAPPALREGQPARASQVGYTKL